MEFTSSDSAFRLPSVGAALCAAASVVLCAITMAPRGILYLFHVRNASVSVSLSFWFPMLVLAFWACLTESKKFRRALIIVLVAATLMNLSGCFLELPSQLN